MVIMDAKEKRKNCNMNKNAQQQLDLDLVQGHKVIPQRHQLSSLMTSKSLGHFGEF